VVRVRLRLPFPRDCGGNVHKQAPTNPNNRRERLYRIVFHRGGQVKILDLKNYKDRPDGNPLELVNKAAAEKYGLPTFAVALREGLATR